VKDVIAEAIRESLAKAGIAVRGEERGGEFQMAATATAASEIPAFETSTQLTQPAIDFVSDIMAFVPTEQRISLIAVRARELRIRV
jgi:hypothetical protein